MILVSHAQGNAFVRGLLAGLQRHSVPLAFHTTLGFAKDERWLEGLPDGLRRGLARRQYDVPADSLHRRPLRELVRLGPNFPGSSGLRTHEYGWASVDGIWRDLDNQVAKRVQQRRNLTAVYTYEDGALASLQAARRRGLPGFYDLPIGYWREAQRIFAEEAELSPTWAATLEGLRDSPEKLARKDQELAAASHVVVASSFTHKTLDALPGGLTAPVTVIPYGSPPVMGDVVLDRKIADRRRRSGPLRVLFVGGLSQRKGLSYLFAGVQQIRSQVSLTVVGRRPAVPCEVLDKELQRCRYIPTLAPADLLVLMRDHDVLVLPSLFEGFGLVLLEAMSQGLPIIATPHTAAPDLLQQGNGGIVVPVRDSKALANALTHLIDQPDSHDAMARAAHRIASQFTWPIYGDRLVQLITSPGH